MRSDLFLEATDNICAMHEIDSILKNDDIPADSRQYFLQIIKLSLEEQNRTPTCRQNMNVLRKLFSRIDKDTRLFRTFLNLAVELASHFKFENTSIVYAFQNISLEDHFCNFVDFARRQNPIIDKNSPLQLFLSLGLSIISLALQKNEMENKKRFNAAIRKTLLDDYEKLSRNMGQRFINMEIISKHKKEDYINVLDDFNQDNNSDIEIEEEEEEVKKEEQGEDAAATPTKGVTVAQIHTSNKQIVEITSGNIHDIMKDLAEKKDDIAEGVKEKIPKKEVVAVADDSSNTSTTSSSSSSSNNEDDYVKPDELSDDNDSGFIKDFVQIGSSSSNNDSDNEILKTLENGDKELNLRNFDSMIMEAGRQFGPNILKSIAGGMEQQQQQRQPVVRFHNNVQNIVDFIQHSESDE